jgi:Muramidase (flagellum-specific)
MSIYEAFITRILPYVLADQLRTGVPASLTLAQAALESNWGRSGLTQKANNLFGIKGVGPAGSVTMATTEYADGRATQVQAAFRAYNSWEESISDHSALLSRPRYKKALNADGRTAAREVAAAGYATDPGYADKLISLMNTYDLYQYDVYKPNPSEEGEKPPLATSTPGIDCATPLTAQTAKQIAAAGYKFAARYLVPANYTWKRLTRSEAEAITAAGMQIVSVYETSADRPKGGASAGKADGAAALKEAQTIAQPPGSAIYFAVDYDAQPSDYYAIEAYLNAAAAEIPGYETGVYGSYAVIEEMHKRGACKHFWQTYAWSKGKESSRANIYQYKNGTSVAGVSLDLNRSYGGEGWWNTNEEEGEITMSKEDAEKIIKFLSAGWYAAVDQASKDEFNRLANEVRKAAGIPV